VILVQHKWLLVLKLCGHLTQTKSTTVLFRKYLRCVVPPARSAGMMKSGFKLRRGRVNSTRRHQVEGAELFQFFLDCYTSTQLSMPHSWFSTEEDPTKSQKVSIPKTWVFRPTKWTGETGQPQRKQIRRRGSYSLFGAQKGKVEAQYLCVPPAVRGTEQDFRKPPNLRLEASNMSQLKQVAGKVSNPPNRVLYHSPW